MVSSFARSFCYAALLIIGVIFMYCVAHVNRISFNLRLEVKVVWQWSSNSLECQKWKIHLNKQQTLLNGISAFCAKRIQMNNCKVPINPSRKIVELGMLL